MITGRRQYLEIKRRIEPSIFAEEIVETLNKTAMHTNESVVATTAPMTWKWGISIQNPIIRSSTVSPITLR